MECTHARKSSVPLAVAFLGLALAITASVWAQGEKPVDLGSLDSSTAQIGGEGLQIHGFGIADYEANFSSGENSFDASALALSIYDSVLSNRLSFFGQLTAHRSEEDLFSGSEQETTSEEAGGTETEIDNMFANWVISSSHGIDLTFGKFDSPLGLERDDAPLNFQATNSFVFEFARPVKFTGLMLHQAVSPKFDGYAIVANGWDSDVDTNSSKTGALYGVWSPSLAAHFGLGAIEGREGELSLKRSTVVGTVLVQPASNWVFGGEAVAGRQKRPQDAPGSDTWSGATLFLHHRFEANAPGGGAWALTLRGETLDDSNAARTGIAQRLTSVTISPQWLVGGSYFGPFHYLARTTLELPRASVRLDLRWVESNRNVFDHGEGVLKQRRTSATLQFVYVF